MSNLKYILKCRVSKILFFFISDWQKKKVSIFVLQIKKKIVGWK